MHISYVRPVGESISIKKQTFSFNSDYAFHGYQSGTMALQSAIQEAKKAKSQLNNELSEVLIPAYACPDLVTACDGAKTSAKLVDTQKDYPFPTIESIKAAKNQQTIAIVLPAFLGIKPSLELVKQSKALGLFVICDYAQSPFNTKPNISEDADAYIYSFGKGKPVSLLGGGAMLLSPSYKSSNLHDSPNTSLLNKFKLSLKITAYNIVISRLGYAVLMSLFGNRIGKTEYKQALDLKPLDQYRQHLLLQNIDNQQTQIIGKKRSTVKALQDYVTRNGLHTLPTQFEDETSYLRFPLLCNSLTQKESLLKKLNSSGIGASAMYRTTVPQIESIPSYVREQGQLEQRSFSNAEEFAQRLITLPCHSSVTNKDLKSIERILMQYKEEQ